MGEAGVPLVESKLHVPRRRRGVVPRARLDQRLDRDSLPPVVLVSAPAGFGKTTLLSEWLAGDKASTERTAWLSLDRRDSDPSGFWSYVVAAVRKVAPEVGADALATLRATPAALENVVATLLNDLTGHDGEVVLVLDDYHVVESIEVQRPRRAGLGLLRGDLAGTIAHGERAAGLSTDDDHLGRAAAAAALIGLAQWADGDLEAGARQYAAAIAEFEAAGYFADILGCSLGLADMQAGQGHRAAHDERN